MTLPLILSPRARADLDDIWAFSAATWSPAQADRYLKGMDEVLHLLCRQPGVARLKHEVYPSVRLHPYRSHIIFFRSDAGTMDVIRILHARSESQSEIAK